jgi:hypothetical protein
MKRNLPENQTRSQRLGFWGPRLLQALLLACPAIALPPAQAALRDPTNQGAAPSGTVVVPVPSPYSYDAGSLKQLNLKGNFGRYIGFTGHTVIEWPATPARLNPGQPGTLQCRYGSCWLQGTIAPTLIGGTPAGSIRSFFRYQLDCLDRSFNRIGDVRVPGAVPKGWQAVENDPTALAVAETWCPRIQELPQ